MQGVFDIRGKLIRSKTLVVNMWHEEIKKDFEHCIALHQFEMYKGISPKTDV